MSNELAQQLTQILNVAKADLREMKWRNQNFERYEDYERGYANGHEEVMEEYENLVDDLEKVLKQYDIEITQTSKRIAPKNQLSLL